MNLNENINRIKEVMGLNEQSSVPLLTVLANPAAINFSTDNEGKKIYLSQRNKTGQIVPNSTYSYLISGKYGLLGFEVVLRNLKREPNGDLIGEAKPTGWFASKLTSLIPKNSKTQDDWIKIKVPNLKINEALTKLRNNKGSTATIDAGSGVEVELKLNR